MRRAPATGCALCGATWGDYRATVDGVEWSFCCDACARFYDLAVQRTKRETGWASVDRLFLDHVQGNEADGWAQGEGEEVTIHVSGSSDGSELHEYRVLSRSERAPGPRGTR